MRKTFILIVGFLLSVSTAMGGISSEHLIKKLSAEKREKAEKNKYMGASADAAFALDHMMCALSTTEGRLTVQHINKGIVFLRRVISKIKNFNKKDRIDFLHSKIAMLTKPYTRTDGLPEDFVAGLFFEAVSKYIKSEFVKDANKNERFGILSRMYTNLQCSKLI